MSDTSFDSEEAAQNPAKRSRISTCKNNTKQTTAVMNFAGHSPTKNSGAHKNLFLATESDNPVNPVETQQTVETSHRPETPNLPQPLIPTPSFPTNINDPAMEAYFKNLMEETRQGHTDTQDKILTAFNEATNKLEIKLGKVDQKVDGIGEDINGLKTAFEAAVKRIDTLEKELEGAKLGLQTLEQLHSRTSTQFRDMKDAQLRSMEHTFDNYLILRGIPIEENETSEELKGTINDLVVKAGINAPCNSVMRVGKLFNGTRPTRVYWMNQEHRNDVLRNGNKLHPIKVFKDLPFPVRQVQRKIRARGWELRKKDVKFEYRDLGLYMVDKSEFVHHEDIVLENDGNAQSQVERMEVR